MLGAIGQWSTRVRAICRERLTVDDLGLVVVYPARARAAYGSPRKPGGLGHGDSAPFVFQASARSSKAVKKAKGRT